jgi:hypothetical protein
MTKKRFLSYEIDWKLRRRLNEAKFVEEDLALAEQDAAEDKIEEDKRKVCMRVRLWLGAEFMTSRVR